MLVLRHPTATLAVCATFAALAHANVFVSDARVQVDPNSASFPPAKSVGRVQLEGMKGNGSAWIVRDNLLSGCFIATNYHVGFMKEKNEATGRYRLTKPDDKNHSIQFQIGPDARVPGVFAEVVFARAVAWGNFDKNDESEGHKNDWAIFKLDRLTLPSKNVPLAER
jgi:hypothetical protein